MSVLDLAESLSADQPSSRLSLGDSSSPELDGPGCEVDLFKHVRSLTFSSRAGSSFIGMVEGHDILVFLDSGVAVHMVQQDFIDSLARNCRVHMTPYAFARVRNILDITLDITEKCNSICTLAVLC